MTPLHDQAAENIGGELNIGFFFENSNIGWNQQKVIMISKI